jgi:hypothetical protein
VKTLIDEVELQFASLFAFTSRYIDELRRKIETPMQRIRRFKREGQAKRRSEFF